MNSRRGPRRKAVLYSFRSPTTASNPYVSLLAREVASAADVIFFSWPTAIFGHYDVFHVHWPETMIRGSTVVKRLGSYAVMLILIVRLRLFNIRVVRTVHNVDPHEAGGWAERVILSALNKTTSTYIVMSQFTELPGLNAFNVQLVPHPHFIEWYAGSASVHLEATRGRLANFGLLRSYKGVEGLVEAFAEVPGDEELSLSVVGQCADERLRALIVGASQSVPALTYVLRHVTDDELVAHIRTAELVVLPYRKMLNSGAVLSALSLGRPVLVPRNATNEALANEVGRQWVHMFDAEITGEDLVRAVEQVRVVPPGVAPDLGARGWDTSGAAHLDIYGFESGFGAT